VYFVCFVVHSRLERSAKRSAMALPLQITERLNRLGVSPADVEERFVRGSGPGGQKIKTSCPI
jgi:protein subunit release factor B